MNRADLLRRAGVGLLGLAFGRHLDFPTPVLDAADAVWTPASFPTGTFIHIDQGTLELGIIRDSLVKPVAEHHWFAETFENAAVLTTVEAPRG